MTFIEILLEFGSQFLLVIGSVLVGVALLQGGESPAVAGVFIIAVSVSLKSYVLPMVQGQIVNNMTASKEEFLKLIKTQLVEHNKYLKKQGDDLNKLKSLLNEVLDKE